MARTDCRNVSYIFTPLTPFRGPNLPAYRRLNRKFNILCRTLYLFISFFFNHRKIFWIEWSARACESVLARRTLSSSIRATSTRRILKYTCIYRAYIYMYAHFSRSGARSDIILKYRKRFCLSSLLPFSASLLSPFPADHVFACNWSARGYAIVHAQVYARAYAHAPCGRAQWRVKSRRCVVVIGSRGSLVPREKKKNRKPYEIRERSSQHTWERRVDRDFPQLF